MGLRTKRYGPRITSFLGGSNGAGVPLPMNTKVNTHQSAIAVPIATTIIPATCGPPVLALRSLPCGPLHATRLRSSITIGKRKSLGFRGRAVSASIGAVSRNSRLIACNCRVHIAATESVSLCGDELLSAFVELEAAIRNIHPDHNVRRINVLKM